MNRLFKILFINILLLNFAIAGVSASNVAGENYVKALLGFEDYVVTQWKDCPSIPNSGYWGSGVSGKSEGMSMNDGIRSMNGVALSHAVLILAQPENVAKNRQRLSYIERVLRYSALTHESSGTNYKCADKRQWGAGWQTNLWAATMGLTAMLLEDQLPADLITKCKAVVAYEADYRATLAPVSEYFKNTGAEENAWNSNAVSLAATWLSDDPRAAKWLKTAKSYLANVYTTEADNNRSDMMADWVTTTNLYPSYMLENHGFYHPGYHTVAAASVGDSFIMSAIANKAVAKELEPFCEFNIMKVWDRIEPLYKSNGEIIYPCGEDWSLHGYGHVSYTAFIATHFHDGRASLLQDKLSSIILEKQEICGTGEFIGKSNENKFYAEAVTARRIALSWLHNQLIDFKTSSSKRLKSVSYHTPDVKMIVSRSKHGNVTLSYGNRIVLSAESTPGSTLQSEYIACPRNLSFIGNTPYGVAKSAELLDCELYNDGFRAKLNIKSARGEVACDIYTRDGVVAVVQVPLGGGEEVAEPKLFQLSIENYWLNGAKRDIFTQQQSYTVNEASGVQLELPSSLNISDNYGVIYGPNAKSIYTSVKSYNLKGAAVDNLSCVLERPYKPSYAIILCDVDAAKSQKVSESVDFECDDNNCVLSFKSPTGKRVKLTGEM